MTLLARPDGLLPMFFFDDSRRGAEDGRGAGDTDCSRLIDADGVVNVAERLVRDPVAEPVLSSVMSPVDFVCGRGGAAAISNVGAVVMIVGVRGGSGNGGISS